jgi:Cd2+/Zn2+-exporting ATPase
MDLNPEYANVLRDGEVTHVEPDEVAPGETILIRPGEKIPLDGVVTKGQSDLDTRALTGESVPRDVAVGSEVSSGCVTLTGRLELRVPKAFEDSTVAKILELVEPSAMNKAKSEPSSPASPTVQHPRRGHRRGAAGLHSAPLCGNWPGWIKRALIFLVVSCPWPW